MVFIVGGIAACTPTRPEIRVGSLAHAGRANSVQRFERSWGGAHCREGDHQRAQRLISDLLGASPEIFRPVRFSLLQSNERAAFSLHPDRIYVSRGLYRELNDDRLLAAVLAHELAHLAEDETALACIDGVPAGLAREMAADARGARMLQQAGYRAVDLIDALATVEDLQPPGWFDQRAEALLRLDPSLALAGPDRL